VLTGSIPPTGIPLPFVSAGGTSVSVFMGAIGILCNIGKSTVVKEKNKDKHFDGVLFKKKEKRI